MSPADTTSRRRDQEMTLGLHAEEKDLLRRAACHLGFNFITEFVRSVALERAREALADSGSTGRRP